MTPTDVRAVAAALADPAHANAVDAVNWAAAVHGHAAIVRLAEWVVGQQSPARPTTQQPATSDHPPTNRKAA